MRISNERRRDTEQRVRAAARAMLAGEIPAGRKCDITTLARQAGISRATLYRSYPHLKAEFEDQLAQRQASGCAPDPRDTQVLRLQDENARLKDRLAAHGSALALLGEFKILALSQLAAQHEEIKRLRAGHTAAARSSGTVLDLPASRTSRHARPARLKANCPAAAPRPDTASPAHPCDVRHARDPLSHPKADATAAPQPLRPTP